MTTNCGRLLAVSLAANALLATTYAQDMPPANVVLAEAELRQTAPSVDVPGTVVSRHDSRLSSELSARLVWIAEVGTRVKEGDTVARLDDFSFNLLEKEAQSVVEREQAAVRFLRTEKKRLEELSKRNLSAESQLDQTIADLAIAESEVKIARAKLGLAQVQMHVTKIRAPFDGIVTERLRGIGERLNVADEVIRLVDPDALEVVARAPLNSVNFIHLEDTLELHNDFRRGHASVRTIVPFGSPQSHMFEVRLSVDSNIWTVGESVRLSMPTAAATQVMAVPRDALILRREGASVFKVNSDMTVAQVNVITGIGAGQYIEVHGDLKPGDRVVTRGAERLSTGMLVNPTSSQSNTVGNAASNGK